MDSSSDKKPDVSSSCKKEMPSGMQKVCLVCGDKALGYNFNAISCESCKAFFRRNALTNKEFKCPFTNNCEINVVTRRFCQKCRMVKCLAIGMVKEFIMSEEDKAEKRRKIEENRAKKRRSEPRDAERKTKLLKQEDRNSNTSKEDSDNTYKENSNNMYRDENSNAYIDNNSNTFTEEPTTTTYNNTSNTYRENPSVYKQENSINPYREDEASIFPAESSTSYREITVKNREDSCFSFRENTIPYKDDSSMSFRDSTVSYKPDSSIPFQEEAINAYVAQTPESTVQYDILNNTSPNSSMQLTPNNDIDSSIHSPPVYNPYSSVRSNEMPYSVRGYPINENGVINRGVYDHQMDGFRTETSNGMYPERKQNSIRSLLTNGDIGRQAVCDQTPGPSNSSEADVNKAKEILQDVERIEPNSMESILCEAIKLEFEAYTSVNPCPSSRELNDVERAKLNELIVANKALHAPIDQDLSVLIGDTASVGIKEGSEDGPDPRLVKIVNLTAVAIRRFIKMAKKINAFKSMCEEDQIALLKGGCIEMLVLRSAMQYDGQRNTWKVPHSQEEYKTIRTDVLKLAKGNVYSKHEAFIRSFEQRWRSDENIILIMSAILLFTPERAKVVHRDVIKLEQNSYYYLLRRYLESVYPGCEAKSTFLKLIQKILELRKLAGEVTEVYLDVNPIEPLLMEIFDLKHHAA